ncbi:MAG: hypothetical protein HPY69_01120 [Armatimonadetes bacterium]|nr:hypothetical protein [Armatimonadota bacterium]
MSTLRSLARLSLWFCLILWLQAAQAATYWLATDGSDTNPGTREAPFRTWKYAVSQLTQDGDELVVRPGRYGEAPGAVMPERPEYNDWVTIRAEEPGTVQVWYGSQYVLLCVRPYTRVSGIWFSGGSGIRWADKYGPKHHLIIENCEFKSTQESMAVTGRRCGRPMDLVGGDYLTLRNCLFAECVVGPTIGDTANRVSNVLVENCTFAHNYSDSNDNVDGIIIEGIREGPDNTYITDQNIKVRNCVAWGHGDAGFDIKPVATIENCVAYGNAYVGYKLWGVGTKLINCLAYGNGDAGASMANNNQSADRCTFVDNATYAVRPQAYSGQTISRSIIVGPMHNANSDTQSVVVTDSAFWIPGANADTWAITGKHVSYSKIVFTWGEVLAGQCPAIGNGVLLVDPELTDTYVPTATGTTSWGYKCPDSPPGFTDLSSLSYRGLIRSHTPASYATDVPRSTAVEVTFTEAVEASSACDAFSLTPVGGQPVVGKFDWPTPGLKLRFRPSSPLPPGTVCNVRLCAGVVRQAGGVSGWDESFSFTTSSAPLIGDARPQGKAVPVDKTVRITFDSAMDQASVESAFTISPSVEGTFSWSGNELTFTPTAPLSYSTTYTVTISNSARGATGTALSQSYSWSFDTAAPPVPRVVACDPEGDTADIKGPITIAFDQAMHRASVERCFSIEPSVVGSFGWAENKLIFKPAEPLASDTDYTVTVGSHARSDQGVELGKPFAWTFHTAPGPAPMVTASAPRGTTVPCCTKIRIAFDQPMHRTSVQKNFSIEPAVPGKQGWIGNEFIFTPSAPLPYSTDYVVTIGKAARTVVGVPLRQAVVLRFRTVDPVPPRAAAWEPRGTTVPLESRISVDFDQPMHRVSVQSNFSISPQVAGRFGWDRNSLVFIPDKPLRANTRYTITLQRGARSAAGLRLRQEVAWSFRTAAGPTPRVVAKAPEGTGVDTTSRITVTFSLPMHRRSVESCFSIEPAVAGSFAWRRTQLIFRPTAPLQANTCYKVTIGQHARSTAGVELGENFWWSFTTGSASPLTLTAAAASTSAGAQITVNLSAAAQVGVEIKNLAGRTVAVLPQRSLGAGVHSLLWSGRGVTGTKVPAGQYLVCVRAVSRDGAQVQHLAPLAR